MELISKQSKYADRDLIVSLDHCLISQKSATQLASQFLNSPFLTGLSLNDSRLQGNGLPKINKKLNDIPQLVLLYLNNAGITLAEVDLLIECLRLPHYLLIFLRLEKNGFSPAEQFLIRRAAPSDWQITL